MADPVTDLQLLLRVVIACMLGGIIGWERESMRKPAGLRTQMLVGGSSALFVTLSEVLIGQFAQDAPNVRFDMIGIFAAIATGVSFLGAGAIFSSGKEQHRGLTTAASLLATSAIGVSCGLTRYTLAVGATLTFLFILKVLGQAKDKVIGNDGD